MASSSLESSIDRAAKHYSSLFTLPSYRTIFLLTSLLCILGSILTVFLFADALFLLTLQFGLLLFLLSTLSDLIVRMALLKADPVYNLRRCAALSLFSLLLWFGFLLLGSLLTRVLTSLFWVYAFSIGFSAVCTLRLIVLSSTSSASNVRAIGASLAQPVICLIPMFSVAFSFGYVFKGVEFAIYFAASIAVSIITARIFTRAVDNVGVTALQTPTTTVLKAFLANWMENLTGPLERLFDKFGREGKVEFSLLGFKTDDSAGPVIVVSSFHPGPFKNVGSSLLPSMIQAVLEKSLGCVAAVPHGLFGHEFDLSSQRENQKVLEAIITSAHFSEFASEATKFVRVQKGAASASCQLFGRCALLTLTLAPETTEDFPQEVGDSIVGEAAKLGLEHVVIINAHNSINGLFHVNTVLGSLKEASLRALETASELQPSPFEVGAAKTVPEGLNVEDGMGPGGICTMIFKVGGEASAYVTIDGNNMVSGLREKIFASLRELGIQNGEIFTTDTHAVNAVVMTTRGYHPLGEAIPHERLISDIKGTVTEALSDMKPASAGWRSGTVPNVRIIGEKQIEEMSLLADKAVQEAKKTAVPLFAAAGVVLVLLLTIL